MLVIVCGISNVNLTQTSVKVSAMGTPHREFSGNFLRLLVYISSFFVKCSDDTTTCKLLRKDLFQIS